MSLGRTIKEYIVAEYLPGTSYEELESSYDLLETGVVDSLSLLRLISWVSERYSLPIDELEISPENFRSVEAIQAFVEQHRANHRLSEETMG